VNLTLAPTVQETAETSTNQQETAAPRASTFSGAFDYRVPNG